MHQLQCTGGHMSYVRLDVGDLFCHPRPNLLESGEPTRAGSLRSRSTAVVVAGGERGGGLPASVPGAPQQAVNGYATLSRRELVPRLAERVVSCVAAAGL